MATWRRVLQAESSMHSKDSEAGACLYWRGWITEEGSQVGGRVMSGVRGGDQIQKEMGCLCFRSFKDFDFV